MSEFRSRHGTGPGKKPTDRSHDGEPASGAGSPSHQRRPLFRGNSNVELPPNSHPSLGLVLEAGRWVGTHVIQGETQDSQLSKFPLTESPNLQKVRARDSSFYPRKVWVLVLIYG
jgi:hypothetical protein